MTVPSPETAPQPRSRTLRLVLVAAAAGLVAAVALLYARGAFDGNAGNTAASCRTGEHLAALAKGEMAGFLVARKPLTLPDLAFTGPEGQPMKLSDFRGRTVLLNLWATWCVPCREEMPALDAVQARFGAPGFEVVALNIDQREAARPKEWLAGINVTRLAFYADRSANVFQDLRRIGRAPGMPTTILIDPQGCELGYLPGYAKWDSADATALLTAALKP